jgi:rod shape-determining protein MreD
VSGARWLLAGVLLVLARVVDVAVLARSPLAELGPDLTLLVVVAFAVVEGRTTGAAVGLLAGLVADLTPPVTGPLGLSALGYALAAVAAGRWRRVARRSVLAPAGAAAAAALVLGGVRLVAGAMAGGEPSTTALAGSVLTAAALALAVVPAVVALDRRVAATETPELLRW